MNNNKPLFTEGLIPSFIWSFVKNHTTSVITAGILAMLIWSFMRKNKKNVKECYLIDHVIKIQTSCPVKESSTDVHDYIKNYKVWQVAVKQFKKRYGSTPDSDRDWATVMKMYTKLGGKVKYEAFENVDKFVLQHHLLFVEGFINNESSSTFDRILMNNNIGEQNED